MMDALISSLGDASLGGSIQKLEGMCEVYISEVSSVTRLWIQEVNNAHWQKLTEMRNFYDKQGADDFKLVKVEKGMKVVAFGCGQWDRAEIVSDINPDTGRLKLFFIDFGTTGTLSRNNCKILIEDYATIPRQAIRGALHGIKPLYGTRLWDMRITEKFINLIHEKKHKIQIVKHHEYEDFYEFLLYDNSGNCVNEAMVKEGVADPIESNETPECLMYPPFKMLEQLYVYPSYGDRYWIWKQIGMNFNDFEERNIPPVTNSFAFENELKQLLTEKKYETLKNCLLKLIRG